jgi:8-oxo-dGTP diphosphatase
MLYDKNIPFHVVVEFIIFGFDEGELKLLATKKHMEQDRENWSLINGFLEEDENLKQAATRILNQQTGLYNVYLEQLYTYSNPDYDPGTQVISVAYYAIIRLSDQNKELPKDLDAKWFNLKEIQELIFDPEHIIDKAVQDLQEHAKAIPVGITLLPDKFTLTQLQAMYEAIFQKKLDRGNFRKNILSIDLLEKLDEKDKSGSRKGAWFYKFNEDKFNNLIDKGVLIKTSL